MAAAGTRLFMMSDFARRFANYTASSCMPKGLGFAIPPAVRRSNLLGPYPLNSPIYWPNWRQVRICFGAETHRLREVGILGLLRQVCSYRSRHNFGSVMVLGQLALIGGASKRRLRPVERHVEF